MTGLFIPDLPASTSLKPKRSSPLTPLPSVQFPVSPLLSSLSRQIHALFINIARVFIPITMILPNLHSPQGHHTCTQYLKLVLLLPPYTHQIKAGNIPTKFLVSHPQTYPFLCIQTNIILSKNLETKVRHTAPCLFHHITRRQKNIAHKSQGLINRNDNEILTHLTS